jgi:hypothetical protein
MPLFDFVGQIFSLSLFDGFVGQIFSLSLSDGFVGQIFSSVPN